VGVWEKGRPETNIEKRESFRKKESGEECEGGEEMKKKRKRGKTNLSEGRGSEKKTRNREIREKRRWKKTKTARSGNKRTLKVKGGWSGSQKSGGRIISQKCKKTTPKK